MNMMFGIIQIADIGSQFAVRSMKIVRRLVRSIWMKRFLSAMAVVVLALPLLF